MANVNNNNKDNEQAIRLDDILYIIVKHHRTMLGLAVLGGIFAVIHATGSDPKHMLEAGTMHEMDNNFSGMFDISYFLMVAMFAVAIIAILFFVVRQLLDNFKNDPKKAKGSLIAVGLLVVMVLVAFLLAKGTDVSNVLLEKNNLTQSASRWIGAACISVYILFIAAVVAIIYAEVSKALKKK